MEKIKCWHFLQSNKQLRWGTKEVCKVGKIYTAEGELKLCKNGMHGSRKITDALQYAPGNICCQVEIWDEVVEDKDKLVGRNRKILEMINAEKILRKFACLCALDVIDKWDAPEVVIKYLKTGNEKLRAAAWHAARAAAENAARAAAENAARAAAENAAGDAAWHAARAAAENAAWAAAWDAARDAAGAAARDAAWEKQEKRLVRMMNEAMK
jgi:hypothetical protein